MLTSDALLDVHERAHRNLSALMTHCRGLDQAAIDRELAGFGYPTVRLQLHHEISAERYWVSVLEDRMDADENDADYPTIASLELYRDEVAAGTEAYLHAASVEELNTPRAMRTWGGREPVLIPAHVVLRTQMHLYHHQGQILAMCRLLGKPTSGMDYPIT